MPAYNAEKYIGEAIESILNQTFKEFEFIIIDDCSTDGTWGIIQKYAAKDPRIVPLQNEKNLSISPTRNKLIGLSKGKYVVWQDADDISIPYRLEHQYKYMEEHLEVGISAGYLHYFNENGMGNIRKYAPDDTTLRSKIFRYSPCAQPAAIIRRECFKKVGLFPMASPVAEDLAMSFQIGTQYKFGNIQEVLIKYRETDTGVTYTKLRIMELYTIFLRYRFAGNGYTMTLGDKVYTLVQYFSVFLIPPKLKIMLFNLIRNS